jgi:hypothetical protein
MFTILNTNAQHITRDRNLGRGGGKFIHIQQSQNSFKPSKIYAKGGLLKHLWFFKPWVLGGLSWLTAILY